jgi:hypothetical protein
MARANVTSRTTLSQVEYAGEPGMFSLADISVERAFLNCPLFASCMGEVEEGTRELKCHIYLPIPEGINTY